MVLRLRVCRKTCPFLFLFLNLAAHSKSMFKRLLLLTILIISLSNSYGQGLSKAEARQVATAAMDLENQKQMAELQKIWNEKSIKQDTLEMKFSYRILGEKPEDGRSLYISLHGGGNTSPAANDQQWKNQINLYTPKEGVYLAPRAPTNTWNLWHEDHIDDMFAKLIKAAVKNEGVNPNKVYLLGYSAGGMVHFNLHQEWPIIGLQRQ